MNDLFQTALSRSPLLCECAAESLSPVFCAYAGGESVSDVLDGVPCVGLVLSGAWRCPPTRRRGGMST